MAEAQAYFTLEPYLVQKIELVAASVLQFERHLPQEEIKSKSFTSVSESRTGSTEAL